MIAPNLDVELAFRAKNPSMESVSMANMQAIARKFGL
jgi:hypothetical protein